MKTDRSGTAKRQSNAMRINRNVDAVSKQDTKTPDDKRESVLSVLKQFRVVVRSIKRHYQSVERSCGVSGAQLWAMAEIAAAPGIKVGQLAKELAVHQSTVSNMLDRLEELEFVTRRRIADDQRIVQLFLTPKGIKSIKTAPKPAIGVLQHALSTLSDRRLKSLHDHLDEVVCAMKLTDKSDMKVLLSDSLSGD
jgi:DNA-binding MarR family transcriptional regulator